VEESGRRKGDCASVCYYSIPISSSITIRLYRQRRTWKSVKLNRNSRSRQYSTQRAEKRARLVRLKENYSRDRKHTRAVAIARNIAVIVTATTTIGPTNAVERVETMHFTVLSEQVRWTPTVTVVIANIQVDLNGDPTSVKNIILKLNTGAEEGGGYSGSYAEAHREERQSRHHRDRQHHGEGHTRRLEPAVEEGESVKPVCAASLLVGLSDTHRAALCSFYGWILLKSPC
jgi:hypothetical protein